MSIEEGFKAAAEEIKGYDIKSDDQLLELYALYKQALFGDNNTPKPGLLDFKGKSKWNAWERKKGMSQKDAMKAYMAFVSDLKDHWPKKD